MGMWTGFFDGIRRTRRRLSRSGWPGLIVVVVTLWPTSGRGQTVPAGTEEAFVRMAMEQNAGMLAIRERAAETAGLLRQAGLRPNPGVEFEFTDGGLLGSSGERELTVGYAHTLELGGKLDRRVDVARIGDELARLEILDRQRLLRSEVRQVFAAALAARRNLQTATELVEANEASYQLVRMRIDEGESAPLEGGLLQVELNRLRTDRLLFEAALERAGAELQTLAGLKTTTEVEISGTLEMPTLNATLDALIERALATRPDLEASRIGERLGAAQIDLAEAEGVPNAVVFGRYTRSTGGFDQLGLSASGGPVPITATDNTWSAGIAFNLPFSDRNQGNIEAAAARRRAATLEREYLEQVVRNEVRAAYESVEAAREMLRLFDNQILNQAESNLETVRTAYQFGELRLLDVVAEQRRLIDTQTAYTAALEQFRSAFIELERAVGTPLADMPSIAEVNDVHE